MKRRKHTLRQSVGFSERLASSITELMGGQALLNIEPSWEAIADRINPYSLFELLDLCGRLSAVLHNPSTQDESAQSAMLESMSTNATYVKLQRRIGLMRFRRARDGDDPNFSLAIVSNRTLLAVLQVATQVCNSRSQTSAQGPYDDFVEALLIANDIITRSENDLSSDRAVLTEGSLGQIYYLTIIAAEPSSDPVVHLLSRTAELFLTDAPELRNHPQYVDVRALFAEATGLSLESYVLTFLSIVAPLYGIDANNFTKQTASLPHKFFFSERLTFSKSQVEAFLAIAGESVAELVEACRQAYPHRVLRPFYYLPFERSPLVHFSSASVCASAPLLERKLTSGIYHILFNARSGPVHADFRARLQKFFGATFERYVKNTFVRLGILQARALTSRKLATSRSPRWVSESDMYEASGRREDRRPRTCDGLAVIGDTVFVVECKARLLSLATRSGDNQDEFFQRLEEIVIDGARQIDSTIDQLLTGSFESIDLHPEQIRHVFPLVVSLQDFFMNPALQKWILARLHQEQVLQRVRVNQAVIHPIELLDTSDLEWLELAVEHGGRLAGQLLMRKQNNPYGRATSLVSWGQLSGDAEIPADTRASFHAENYEKLTANAIAFFREHSKGS
jgi:hypothetical protein